MKPKHRLLLIASAATIALGGLVISVRRTHEQLYEVTVLPSLPASRRAAINDRGQIAGLRYARASGGYRLFTWEHNTGVQDVVAMDVDNFDFNNCGQLAGTMTDPNGNKQAFFWDPNDGPQMLGTFGGTESFTTALNNLGQVVGFSHRDKRRPQAFIWDRTNGMRSLTPHIQQYGKAHAINDYGQVLGDVGTVIGYSIPHWRPCCWDSTDPAVIQATPPQSADGYSGGSDINNNGYVLHCTYTRQKRAYWVCLWHKDADLKRLFPCAEPTDRIALNDLNQVLYSDRRVSRLRRWTLKHLPFYGIHYLWDPKRGKILLNDQVPRKLGKLMAVTAINDQGCILGMVNPKGSRRGVAVSVLLEPVPERWGN